MTSSKTMVEVAVYWPGTEMNIHRVDIQRTDDDTMNGNLARLRAMWRMIEEDLAKRGLV